MPGLDFLAEQSLDATPTPEAAQDGPARGSDGKFVSVQPIAAPVDEPAPAPTPAATATPEPGHVPLAALLDTRDKLKDAERRAADAEAKLQQQPPAEAPELDPDTENALLQLRLNTSEELVRDKEGDETVDAAKAWAIERFKANPAYQAEVLAKPNPYKFVVAEHKAHLKMEAAKDLDLSDLDAFRAWKAAGGLAAAPPAPAQPAPIPAIPTPPRSLAHAPSAGGDVDTRPQGPGSSFKALFSG